MDMSTKFLLYFPLILTIVALLTIGILHLMGIHFFRKCPKCQSRWTRSSRGWMLTLDPGDGWQFVEDTDCSCCGKSSRRVMPRTRWPMVPCPND